MKILHFFTSLLISKRDQFGASKVVPSINQEGRKAEAVSHEVILYLKMYVKACFIDSMSILLSIYVELYIIIRFQLQLTF